MPLYEYQCDACGHRFEQIQKFSDPPIDVCPRCHETKVRKLLSSPAIQFKGSGWYITDYARKGTGTDGAAPASKEAKDTKDVKSSPSDSSSSASSSGSTDTASAAPSKDS
jgi:putative FmdB family regulatory protein